MRILKMKLKEHDQLASVGALLNPPEPNQALREAAKAYRKTKGSVRAPVSIQRDSAGPR